MDGPQTHRERHGMVYIPEQDLMFLFSGMKWPEDVMVGPEAWYYVYNTNVWTRIESPKSTPALAMYSMACDPTAGQVVLLGLSLTPD